MEYQPVVLKKHPQPSTTRRNPESRYWRRFKHPVFIKEYAPVTSIHFAPSQPHRYAVTAATRVQIYAPRTQKVTKTISRFKDVARSGCIRPDGKLVLAGDDTGLVQVSPSLILFFDRNDNYSSFLTSTHAPSFVPLIHTNNLSMSPNSLASIPREFCRAPTIQL